MWISSTSVETGISGVVGIMWAQSEEIRRRYGRMFRIIYRKIIPTTKWVYRPVHGSSSTREQITFRDRTWNLHGWQTFRRAYRLGREHALQGGLVNTTSTAVGYSCWYNSSAAGKTTDCRGFLSYWRVHKKGDRIILTNPYLFKGLGYFQQTKIALNVANRKEWFLRKGYLFPMPATELFLHTFSLVSA